MADTTIDLLKNSSYIGKMDELIAAVKSGSGATSDVEWDNVKNKPTTIGGYGIIDAKIDNGTITLGNQTITPLTSAPVTSVNSKTGAVVLTANDVGALPVDTVIPTVNDATLTIRRNGVDVGSFTANSADDVNIDINVPTDKSDIGLGNVDNVKQYSATNPPPYPVTSVNGKTGAVNLTASDIGAATTNDIHTAINRTTAVNEADVNYTTLMARGEKLMAKATFDAVTDWSTELVNGAIAWGYE